MHKSFQTCSENMLNQLFISFPQDIDDHVAFIITVPTALAIFFTIFVLVCMETVFRKLLHVFSLVVWACLVAMGYLFMCFGGIISPWDQVRVLQKKNMIVVTISFFTCFNTLS